MAKSYLFVAKLNKQKHIIQIIRLNNENRTLVNSIISIKSNIISKAIFIIISETHVDSIGNFIYIGRDNEART